MSAQLDFKSLSADLLADARNILPQWLPGGKQRGKEFVCGSLSGDEGHSLSINTNTGVWVDFATGDRGADLIDLYAAIHSIDLGAAFRELSGQPARAQLRSVPTPKPAPKPARAVIMPVPQSADLHDCRHPVFGRASNLWPYTDANGELLGYVARYDPAGERKQIVPWTYTTDGWGMGQWPEPRPLYGLQHLAARPEAPVLVVEGEKSVDAAVLFAGKTYVVVTWSGGSNAWQKTDFSPLWGRQVLAWPDADAAGIRCMTGIANDLVENACTVKFLDTAGMPDGWDAADSGFDWQAFKEWAIPRASVFTRAEPVAPTVADTTTEPRSRARARDTIFPGSPLTTAQLFQDQLPDDGKILFWRGEFYMWDGTRYAVRDQVALHQHVYAYMASCLTEKTNTKTGEVKISAFTPKRSHVEDVMHALRAVCFIDLQEPPTWITASDDDKPAGEYIAFKNGFLHAPSRTLHPSSARMFVVGALDFDYDPSAAVPEAWLKFLADLFPGDQESIDCLSEMFGYMLTDDTSQQKAFMMIGPPRSGKGTILRVLESMIGIQNRVSPSLASLGTQFGLQPLIGKRLAMLSDARLSGKTDQQPIVENILRITGEDSLSVERKHIGAWSGKLSTRFVMASNETPAFSDASGALANRFIMFKFSKSFLGSEDFSLTKRLLRELPGITNWALDGLSRLTERGYLISPAAGSEMAQELREQASPIASFVADKCVVHPHASVERVDLFKVWRSWCIDQGIEHHGTMVSFGRRLSAAFAQVGRGQPMENGVRANTYTGIRLKRVTEE
jgi:putative DNA primase/helicase